MSHELNELREFKISIMDEKLKLGVSTIVRPKQLLTDNEIWRVSADFLVCDNGIGVYNLLWTGVK